MTRQRRYDRVSEGKRVKLLDVRSVNTILNRCYPLRVACRHFENRISLTVGLA